MAVNGHYLAKRFQLTTILYIRAYGEWVVGEMLPKFSDLEKRAEKVANAEFDELVAQPVGEDCRDDMSGAAEAAQEKGLAFYDTMFALRQTTLNLFTAGLFHLLEQQLADLCHDGPLLHGSQIQPPNDTNIGVVVNWYIRHFHLDLRVLTDWPIVDELRLVANAVKHAEGNSAQKLRERRPELFRNPFLGDLLPQDCSEDRTLRSPLAGEDFYITERVFQEYSQIVNHFVEELAEYFKEHGQEMYPHQRVDNADA